MACASRSNTIGALLAPIAAVGLMFLFAENIRAVFWIAVIPAVLCFLLAWLALKEQAVAHTEQPRTPFFAGFRALNRPTRRLLAVGFLVMLARFSEGFLILRGFDIGLSATLSPLVLVLFNLAFFALAYPAGALSDRMSPKAILMAGMAVLVAADLILAQAIGPRALYRVAFWRRTCATQGIFRAADRDAAPPHLRATACAGSPSSRHRDLCFKPWRGIALDRHEPAATFLAGAAFAAVA